MRLGAVDFYLSKKNLMNKVFTFSDAGRRIHCPQLLMLRKVKIMVSDFGYSLNYPKFHFFHSGSMCLASLAQCSHGNFKIYWMRRVIFVTKKTK